jgi:hypothetical protein
MPLKFWNDNGYLVIENFNTDKECDELMERSSYLIEHNNFNNQKSIFDTVNQAHNDDNYLIWIGHSTFLIKKNLIFILN